MLTQLKNKGRLNSYFENLLLFDLKASAFNILIKGIYRVRKYFYKILTLKR